MSLQRVWNSIIRAYTARCDHSRAVWWRRKGEITAQCFHAACSAQSHMYRTYIYMSSTVLADWAITTLPLEFSTTVKPLTELWCCLFGVLIQHAHLFVQNKKLKVSSTGELWPWEAADWSATSVSLCICVYVCVCRNSSSRFSAKKGRVENVGVFLERHVRAGCVLWCFQQQKTPLHSNFGSDSGKVTSLLYLRKQTEPKKARGSTSCRDDDALDYQPTNTLYSLNSLKYGFITNKLHLTDMFELLSYSIQGFEFRRVSSTAT